MKILVTGGAGFIGSHLVERLLRQGHHVVVVDNLSTGGLGNLYVVRDHPNLRLEVADISDSSVLGRLDQQFDLIFHLAAAVGVRFVMANRIETIRTNVSTTEAVLSFAAETSIPVFIASSSDVYGSAGSIPLQEDQQLVIGPPHVDRWGYSCSKLMCEFMALACWKERGLPIVIGRLFNTTGPRQSGDYGMVLPTFVRQALAGDPLTVHGDGRQTRCFADVRDVVRAMITLMQAPAAYGGVFNVGSDREVTVGDLARRVKTLAESTSPIVHLPYRRVFGDSFEDIRRRVPDLTKLRSMIGFSPRPNLDRLIRSVIDYERGHSMLPGKRHSSTA